MCKSQIFLLGMSQASLDTPLRWRCQGPSWRLPPERHRAGGCQAGEWLEMAGRHWRLELTARKLSWLGSTGSASFPSTLQACHSSAWGSQTLSKSPATSRGSSVGRMARLLLRKPHVLQSLGVLGCLLGGQLTGARGPLDLGLPGTEAAAQRRSQPSSLLHIVWRC